MIKIRNKRIALLLVLAMMATMFMGIGTASAATTYAATVAPTVAADGLPHNLGSLVVEIDTFSGAATALVSLPTDYDYNAAAIVPSVIVDGGVAPAATFVITDPVNAPNEALLSLTNTTATGLKVVVPMMNIIVPTGAEDDITVEILGLSGQLASGSVVIGHTGTGTVNVTTGTVPSITAAGTTGGKIKLTLKETAAPALEVSTKSVKFTLPYGFEWDVPAGAVVVLAGTDVATAAVDANDERVLLVDVTNTASKSVIRISVDVVVDELKAKFGDVDVRISGDSDVSPSSLVIAKYADFGVEATVEDATEILAGRMEQQVGDIVFTEGAPESAIAGRSFTLELPEGAKWVDLNTTTEKGFGGTVSFLGDNGRTLKVVVTQTGTGTAGTFTLKDVYVDTSVDFSGPLVATIEGKAGIDTEEVTIADVVAPVTVTGTKTDVKIGLTNQLAGTVVITEVDAAALMAGENLLIKCSDDAVDIKDADVEVTDGDLVIGDDSSFDFTNHILTIPIEGESRVASTITISNIMLKVDRTVVEGNLDAKIAGPAVDEFADADKMDKITDVNDFRTGTYDPASIEIDSYDLFGSTAGKTTFAKVVTPAPGEEKNISVFTFGSTAYTINGLPFTMVAPAFAQNNRTYLPVRDVAYALGISDANIIWDQATQTATFMSNGKVVQLKLGSNIMTINSAPVTMDVSVIAMNNRIFLPAAWLATAFGATATWDAAANTVTIAY